MNKTLPLLFVLLVAFNVQGQDIHYSQFYNTPMILNPSNAGKFAGLYRLGANYRDQWRSVTIPYQTSSVFGDLNIPLNRNKPRDRFGFGAAFVNDVAGDGKLHTTKAFVSVAYHKSFNKKNTVIGSVGYGISLVQKKVDFSKLIFDAQWDDDHFDLGIPQGEPFSDDRLNYLDMQAGINLSFAIGDESKMYVSGAMMHLTTPQESFYDDDNEIAMRPVVQIGGLFSTYGSLMIEPHILYSSQRGAMEIIAGTNLLWRLNSGPEPTNKFIVGAWYRGVDALIGVVGVEFKSLTVMGSYDVNLSKLSPASNSQGGFEISLIYIGDVKMKSGIACPAFR